MATDYSTVSDAELSRLVAERFEPIPELLSGNMSDGAEARGKALLKSPLGFWRWLGGWEPIDLATDIACAWRVVERMRQRCYWLKLASAWPQQGDICTRHFQGNGTVEWGSSWGKAR